MEVGIYGKRWCGVAGLCIIIIIALRALTTHFPLSKDVAVVVVVVEVEVEEKRLEERQHPRSTSTGVCV